MREPKFNLKPKEFQDVRNLIMEINCEIYDKTVNSEYDGKFQLTYQTDGFYEDVLFNECVLWSSEDDERVWDGCGVDSG